MIPKMAVMSILPVRIVAARLAPIIRMPSYANILPKIKCTIPAMAIEPKGTDDRDFNSPISPEIKTGMANLTVPMNEEIGIGLKDSPLLNTH